MVFSKKEQERLFMTKLAFEPYKIRQEQLKPLHDTVIVADMAFDTRISQGGIIIPNDNGTSLGIRPRWGRVYAIGPEQKEVKIGQWVLVEHGRWTRGSKVKINGEEMVIRRVDPNCVIFVSDDEPTDDNVSTAIDAQKLQRE